MMYAGGSQVLGEESLDQIASAVARPLQVSASPQVPAQRSLPHVRVAVVGMGYVGLPTALGMAEAGIEVLGYDISESRLATIKAQEADLIEADQQRLARFLGTSALSLSTEPRNIAAADLVLVCVPTPIDEHMVPDLTALRGACASVVEHARAGQTVVLTSTTYVGCTRDLVVAPLAARGLVAGRDVHVVFSPERIDPGNSEHVPEHTPRVVGGATPECARRAIAILGRSSARMHEVSTPEAAELTKLLENTFRAVNISLANEFSGLARELGVDPIEVITAAATKPYGFMPFYPGPGVGGHCIPCDPHYLLWQLKARRVGAPLISAAMEGIAERPRQVVTRAAEVLGEHARPTRGARVLLVGVTYKPGVADIRESPALPILEGLAAAGADLAFYDPAVEAVQLDPALRAEVLIGESAESAATGDWDLVVVHTLQPGTDYSWLTDASVVLDASYKLGATATCHVL